MITLLALLTPSAVAADAFVSSVPELEAAIVAAPATATPLTTIWMLPGLYRVDEIDIDDKAFELRALVPGTVTVQNESVVRLVDVSGQSDIRLRDLDVDAGGETMARIRDAARVDLYRVRLYNGDGGSNPGLLSVEDTATLVLRDSQLRDGTTSGDGGLVESIGNSELTLIGSHFSGGAAGGRGGCVRVGGHSGTVHSSLFETCSADLGGGLATGDTPVTVTDSWFESNSALSRGGALYARGTLELSDTMICRNTSADRPTGGVFWRGGLSNRLVVGQSWVVGNQGHLGSGAGLRIEGPSSSIAISDSLFWSNTSDDSAGLYIDGSVPNASVERAAFVDNLPNTVVNEQGLVPLVNALQFPTATLSGFTVTGLSNADPGFGLLSASACLPPPDLAIAFPRPNDLDGDGAFAPFDCDDTNGQVNPGAAEVCDGIDNDCNFEVDEGLSTTQFYLDVDQDEVGDPLFPVLACGAGHPRADDFLATTTGSPCGGSPLLTVYRDDDGDGFGTPFHSTTSCTVDVGWAANSDDCDDTPGSGFDIHPGSDEICDGIDNNCADGVDEASSPLITYEDYWTDTDGDGYGDENATAITSCAIIAGSVANNEDCDDSVTVGASVHPTAPEICDNLDNDCDGTVDNADSADLTYTTYYRDLDGDGFGDDGFSLATCEGSAPVDYVPSSGDCDDTGLDAPLRFPTNPESCDGIDNDCDDVIDQASAPGIMYVTYYRDLDDDTFGDPDFPQATCDGIPPADHVENDLDCEDVGGSASIRYPGASEVCDGVDNDCDGLIDNADSPDVTYVAYYRDLDGDQRGDPDFPESTCDGTASPSYVPNADDCDDLGPDAALRWVDNAESCDGIDNDCNGVVDDTVVLQDWFQDLDGDGSGDATVVQADLCAPPTVGTWVTDDRDCDDTGPDAVLRSPFLAESCDGIDNDCDLQVDNGLQFTTFFLDLDLDNFGDPTMPLSTCSTPPAGYLVDSSDCDDTTSAIAPGVPEICNGVDEDCNLLVDDGLTFVDYYPDADGDTFGDRAATARSLCIDPMDGSVPNGDDCQDQELAGLPVAAARIHPDAVEVCDGIDNNCDGVLDGADPLALLGHWWPDHDQDGFGDPTADPVLDCAPAGLVSNPFDCDDRNGSVNPLRLDDTCNGIDNNCDEQIDEGAPLVEVYPDLDGDSFGDSTGQPTATRCPAGDAVLSNTDCDDGRPDVHPAMTDDQCDGVDNDCDGLADQQAAATPTPLDADRDGFVVPGPLEQCAEPLPDELDCDDSSSEVYPGAAEYCDGIDTDCDGVADSSDCAPTSTPTEPPAPVSFRMACAAAPSAGRVPSFAILSRRR